MMHVNFCDYRWTQWSESRGSPESVVCASTIVSGGDSDGDGCTGGSDHQAMKVLKKHAMSGAAPLTVTTGVLETGDICP